MPKLNLVVLGSGRGTSMQAIINAVSAQRINANINLVISDNEDSFILKRAKKYNISNKFLDPKGLDRISYDQILIKEIQKHDPDLILLVGFMRILGCVFINTFIDKTLNIHPSLLPKHAGLMDINVHRSVIAAGDNISGCTIHKATNKVDSGEIILQLKCKVDKKDTAESLKRKIQQLEGKAWVEVINSWN